MVTMPHDCYRTLIKSGIKSYRLTAKVQGQVADKDDDRELIFKLMVKYSPKNCRN